MKLKMLTIIFSTVIVYKRLVLFRKTHHFRPLSVETLLFGKSGLSFNDNFLSFQAMQQNGKTRADLHVDFDVPFAQCIFNFEIRKKQMFTEARAFSRVTYFLFSGEPAGFFLKLT